MKWYPGAIGRFREVLATDPEFTHRDTVYFHLAEALLRTAGDTESEASKAARAEALAYYERLLKEFEASEHLENARKRVAELKVQ
jgi:hypothetical protein